jgi:peptidyl-prolyl cis-trans isomerase B (cyclophilin B)
VNVRLRAVVTSLAVAAILAGCAHSEASVPASGRSGCPTNQPPSLRAGETWDATIATSKGSITITLHGALAPVATGNFVALAACHFYDGLGFHRIVPGFVIQGGDPRGDGSGGPGYTIDDDPVTAAYRRGTVAMARTPAPHSAGSQFFIVLSNTASFSPTYAILGEVTAGMEVVDAIAAAADAEQPSNPIVMDSVSVAQP